MTKKKVVRKFGRKWIFFREKCHSGSRKFVRSPKLGARSPPLPVRLPGHNLSVKHQFLKMTSAVEDVITGSTPDQCPGHVMRLPLKTTSTVEDVIMGFTPIKLPPLSYEADVLLMDRENLGI